MDLQDLIALSHEYGTPEFALGGGGNTSLKDRDTMAVKASGVSLGDITERGFVALSRAGVASVLTRRYSADPFEREAEVKRDLLLARLDPDGGRPSVEASLHEMIRWRFVAHTHAVEVNALLCARDAEQWIERLFADRVLVVPSSDPGYTLAKRLEQSLAAWRQAHAEDPHVIFMLNHGLVVAAADPAGVRAHTTAVLSAIRPRLPKLPDTTAVPAGEAAVEVLPAVRMLLSEGEPAKIASIRSNALIRHFLQRPAIEEAILPFTPDHIVYCRTAPLVAEYDGDPRRFIERLPRALEAYGKERGGLPRGILAPGLGLVGADSSKRAVELCLDGFEERLKICYLSRAFGGPRFLPPEAIRFIETWEVESYRRTVSTAGRRGRVDGKVAVVTGAAQGFGRGIAEGLFAEGANVVIADLNDEGAAALAAELNSASRQNAALAVRADVTDAASLARLAAAVVHAFGGVDVLVSNAGVLRAGGIEELDLEDFESVTRVNYTGYFLCVRAFTPILRMQHAARPGYLTDIIEVNSKSGLEGSNRNFAYAGSKFGGIGLTESFALELVGDGVKVNAVCPGNYLEGPLWSDPDKGLFVQYLRTGKVPGAKSVEDVRRFYESRVPLGRGCRPADVVRAILYLVEQRYETGQALPITGGQVMMR
jgi:NAD(P)-dependent dehydrogenase (short-subunit alcohol dehydrogenase family)/rhamnose utilization protein RhaD (predicted bifunctional aldolase and dehydrogenase)